ncbi:MAG: MBL fold metallo-hydrolase [Thermoleophilia bacterium]
MSEPSAVADGVEEVVPGVVRWHVADERIGGFESDAHAVRGLEGYVLIDPLPLDELAFLALGKMGAICLTAACHQRAAWRYRRMRGLEVWAPEGSRSMDEGPDQRYGDGDRLPAGLRAIRTPGPEEAHYCFLLERDPGVLFCSDLLMHLPDGLAFVPAEHHEDPGATRASVERLLDLDFSVICFDHGPPIRDDPKGALRDLLARTAA